MYINNIVFLIRDNNINLDDLILKIKKIKYLIKFLLKDTKSKGFFEEILLFICIKLRQRIEYISRTNDNSISKKTPNIKASFIKIIKKEHQLEFSKYWNFINLVIHKKHGNVTIQSFWIAIDSYDFIQNPNIYVDNITI